MRIRTEPGPGVNLQPGSPLFLYLDIMLVFYALGALALPAKGKSPIQAGAGPADETASPS